MSTKDLTQVALLAAVMAALALFPPLTVPVIAVPITAQSMGPMLAGSLLGARRGALSMLLFLALVALGLPLLAGGHGGLAVFAGPTAGFLAGWVVGAFVIGLLRGDASGARLVVANLVGGIGVVYAIGIPWLSVVAHLDVMKALLGSAVFIPGDGIKVILTTLIVGIVRRAQPALLARA